jgi:hypothetical protein
MASIRMIVRCMECGGTEFKMHDEPKTGDHITCVGCGNLASFGEVLADAKRNGHVLIKGRLDKLLEKYLEEEGDSTQDL